MSKVRLDKFLAHSGYGTRSEVKALLKRKQCTVNGRVETDAGLLVNPESDQIECGGSEVSLQGNRYLALNKPAGHVSSHDSNEGPTIYELLPSDTVRADKLFSVGRLDKQTRGLILITDDGEFSQRINSPKRKIPKTYLVKTAYDIDPAIVTKFREGIFLEDEQERTKPAELKILSPREVELTIIEGKYHQVRRMFAAVHNEVVDLQRISIGKLLLKDLNLKEGEIQALNEEQKALIFLAQ